jgi:hypothetical protein
MYRYIILFLLLFSFSTDIIAQKNSGIFAGISLYKKQFSSDKPIITAGYRHRIAFPDGVEFIPSVAVGRTSGAALLGITGQLNANLINVDQVLKIYGLAGFNTWAAVSIGGGAARVGTNLGLGIRTDVEIYLEVQWQRIFGLNTLYIQTGYYF